jgi:glycerol kinase
VILAVDQGTTGTTCLVVDGRLRVLGRGYRELRQSYPRPGWVEHDPDEIVASVHAAAADALAAAGVAAGALAAMGIANQRETTVVWDAATGRPLYPAIVWQDRRTAERCRTLPAKLLRERTGLVPDPYFSATKLEWLLDRVGGDLRFGTVESWLVWSLTGGAVHVTDTTNASRTLLAALDPVAWDAELLELFGVPEVVLPEIRRSSGTVGTATIAGAQVPIAGLAGDQQAALFGQGCVRPGQGKATYGTGTFVLVNAGEGRAQAPPGILRTAAAQPGVTALEGAIFVTGAAVRWLRDGLGIIAAAEETEALARSVESTGGVHFVPALAGLGSPHWDADARGLISGLTAGTGRAEIARAALEAIAFQTADVVAAMGCPVDVLRADGGASANGWLMQFQADVLGVPVEVAAEREMTAIGAAALAGLAAGVWSSMGELEAVERHAARYEPGMSRDEAETLLAGWRRAVERARSDAAVG